MTNRNKKYASAYASKATFFRQNSIGKCFMKGVDIAKAEQQWKWAGRTPTAIIVVQFAFKAKFRIAAKDRRRRENYFHRDCWRENPKTCAVKLKERKSVI